MHGDGIIRVVTLADNAYSMTLAIMVRSLLENHRCKRPLQITILDGGISPGNRRRLEDSWRSVHQRFAEWEFVAPSFANAGALPTWGRVPLLTYARLALPDYFEDHEGRVVLLDSDTLVLRDLAALHDAELNGAVAGAARDPYIPVVSAIDGLATWRDAGLPTEAPYFNAGVMVIDLARWRQEQITPRALEYIQRERHRLRQYDQDSLNAVLAGRWQELDARWQTHPRMLNSLGRQAPPDAWIVHFSGRLKPWLYPAGGPLDDLFFQYLDRTAWRGFRPPRNLTALALRIYDSRLRRVLYPLESRVLAWKRRVDQKF